MPLGFPLPKGIFRTLTVDNTDYSTNSLGVLEYLVGYRIPANTLGLNDILHVDSSWNKTGVANLGNPRILLGYDDDVTGTILQAPTWSAASIIGSFLLRIRNKNSITVQHTGAASTASGYGTSTVAEATAAIDMSLDTYIVFGGFVNNAADTLTLEHFSISLMKAP